MLLRGLDAAAAFVIATLGSWALAAPAVRRAPQVFKVEPPSWWAGHSLNPVRLLIHGSDLGGARVESVSPDLRLSGVRTNAAGTYLFVDVAIDPGAPAGPCALEITTRQGRAEAFFRVLAPLPRVGRFQGFSPDDVIYLVMPDRFANGNPANDEPADAPGTWNRNNARYYHGGDFQGIINHLPYLKDLGVTALWLTPVYANSREVYEPSAGSTATYTDYHGYEAVDFYAVDDHLGTLAELRELVDKAHALGLKVIQDQVANHTGPRHPWVRDMPTPSWFHGDVAKHLSNAWQKWTLIDPHATGQVQKPTLDGWFNDILPDLNQEDPEVVRYLIQNTLWWVGVAGFDGVRQDTLAYSPRRFWRDWTAAIKREYPGLRVLGEVFDHDPADPALISFFQGGAARFDGIDSGVDSLFDFPLMDAVKHVFIEKKSATELAVVLSHDCLYPRPDMLATLLGSHDEPRFMGRPGADASGLELAFAFLMTTRGIPLIYAGDEIAMLGGQDPDNRRDFPGGWSGDPRNAFISSGRTAKEQSVFEYLRRLIRLRARFEPLRRGRLLDLAVGEKTYVYARVIGPSWAIMALNNGSKPETVEFDLDPLTLPAGVSALKDRFGNARPARVEGKRVKGELPEHSFVVYSPESF